MSLPSLILGNSNKRFSGVTSTMLQTLPGVSKRLPLTVLGQHHLPKETPTTTLLQLVTTRDQKTRLFHARRNNEMIQALIAKSLGAKLKIVFTSTAQRHHSKFTRILMSRMDGIITTCSAANSYLKTPADIIIPHGIDLKKFTPPEDKQLAWNKLNLPGKFGIGIFGRVRPQKGHDLLIDAAITTFKENPDPTLVIVGETTPEHLPFQKQLEAKMNQAGLSDRIHFLGKQPTKRLPELFQAMSLVTALSRNEGFGLTILEAMASGAAVLASRAGAWPDIVTEDLHGRLVPTNDLTATTSALESLLKQDLLELGKNGRKHVERNYSVDTEAHRLVQYYQTHLPSN